ncbi:glyoxalase [Bacillus coahuilensis m2-6]|uniref:VOC family protein n=1 Tax=Bacillus coahuilensis TaxID=408580 RepID=UPI00018506CA|nr:VOC family protein [Bacillus coahuilensis]KUP04520.1 glyoxalase [Bacillus coahuilensis m2-6]
MDIKLGYIILYVENIEKSITFYRDMLGFPVKMQVESYTEFDTGATTLAINTRESVRNLTDLPIPFGKRTEQTSEIGLVTEDVEGLIEQLRSQDVPILLEPVQKPWGQTVAYVSDPDGHFIEICSPIT